MSRVALKHLQPTELSQIQTYELSILSFNFLQELISLGSRQRQPCCFHVVVVSLGFITGANDQLPQTRRYVTDVTPITVPESD